MAKTNKSNATKYSVWGIAAAVVVLIIIIIVQSPTTKNTVADDGPVPSSLLSKLTSIKQAIFDEVGAGSASAKPNSIKAPTLTQNNKPRIVYMGAEYCPYCATERWAVVVALSRFGTITNLKETHSSTTDVYPNTQTFSFHGASYSSPYFIFNGIETESNISTGSAYATLDTPTSEEQGLMNTYDAPPYTSSQNADSIPFIDFGGKYLIIGATYSPSVLQGKSYDQIASALTDPNNTITKGVIGAANGITAAICGITNNKPTNVCQDSTIQTIQKTL